MASFQKSLLALSVSSVLLLAGCSGGSSNPSGDPGASTDGSQTSVAGTAVKGVMKKARVTAVELDGNGEDLVAVGTALTDDDGVYDFTLSDGYSGGPIRLEITVTSETRMRCDAVSGCAGQASGADVELPQDFKLQAVLDGGRKSGDTISASVSPWTTLAAQRAVALVASGETFDKANKRANAETSQILGFDITRTRARDINQVSKESSPEESQYAVMNAVVAELLFKGPATEISKRLASFSKIMDDGQIDGTDEISTVEIASSIKAVRDSDSVRSKLSDNANASLDQNSAKFENDSVKPEIDEDLIIDEDATQAQKIEAYKKFVSQVRTWASSIEQLNEDELTTALEVDLEAVSATFDDETRNQLQLVGELLAQVSEYVALHAKTIKANAVSGTAIYIPVNGLDGVTDYGSIKLTPSDNNGLTLAMNGSVGPKDGTAFIPFDLTLATSIPIDAIDLDGMALRGLGRDTSITLSGTIRDGKGHQVSFNNTGVKLVLREAVSYTPDSAETTEADLGAAFERADFNGRVTVVTPAARFDGTAGFELVRLEGKTPLVANAPVSLKRANVSGGFALEDGSQFNASATLNISNAASFDTLGWLEYSGNSRTVDLALPETAVPGELLDGVETGSFWFWSDSQDEIVADVRGYSATGVTQQYYGLSASQQESLDNKIMLDAKSVLVGQQIIGWNPVTEQEEAVVLTADHLSDLDVGAVNLDDYSSTVTLATDSFYDFGLQGLSVGAENVYGYVDESGRAEFTVEVESIGQRLREFLPTETDTVSHYSYHAQYANEYGTSISYQINASADLYNRCLEAPEETFAYLQGQGSYQSYNDCANLTLNSDSRQFTFTEADKEHLQAAVKQELNALFPNLTIESYGRLSGGGWLENGVLDTYYETGIQFADIETENYFLQGSITVSAGVKIPELADAALTATIIRASRNGGSIEADVTWDGGAYKVRAESADLTNYAGGTDVIFSNSQGYNLNLVLSEDAAGDLDVIGEAFLGDSKVGTVEMRNGIPVITYTNGSETQFESLL